MVAQEILGRETIDMSPALAGFETDGRGPGLADALTAASVTAVPGPQHSGLHKLNCMQAYHTCTLLGIVLSDPMFAESVIAGFGA